MLGPFTTASRLTPIHQVSPAVLSRAACASMSTTPTTTTTTTTTTTRRDRGDRYGPMEWARQLLDYKIAAAFMLCDLSKQTTNQRLRRTKICDHCSTTNRLQFSHQIATSGEHKIIVFFRLTLHQEAQVFSRSPRPVISDVIRYLQI